jgi:hypothetical protein
MIILKGLSSGLLLFLGNIHCTLSPFVPVQPRSLLGTLLDDVLKSEVGAELFNKVERIRSLAQCAAQLANKHDAVSSQALVTHVIPQRQQRVESMPE